MSGSTMALLDAAQLLLGTRKDILAGRTGDRLARVSAPGKHVDVGLTKSGNILVVTGSSGAGDYAFYNLRPLRPLPDMPEIAELTSAQLPARAFHKGFLLHAARVKRFLGSHRPDFIVGHSLGAAAAQILGTALNTPTICLASPQVVKRRFLKPAALRDLRHPQWNVFNLAWRKDFVTQGFRLTGFRALGHRVVVDSQQQSPGIDHFVSQYKDLIIAADAYDVAGIPRKWPDPSFPGPTRLA